MQTPAAPPATPSGDGAAGLGEVWSLPAALAQRTPSREDQIDEAKERVMRREGCMFIQALAETLGEKMKGSGV
jgi:hypothetical protein